MTGEQIRMVGGSGQWLTTGYLDETRITAVRETDIPRHRRRQDGYGTLVPGAHMVQLDGKRWHRVRTTCWSNSGTDFVHVAGRTLALASGWHTRLSLGIPWANPV